MIKFNSVKYKYGTKGGARSVALLLSPQIVKKIDEISGGKGLRSSWVERWLELAIAVQEEDVHAVDRWCSWASQQLSKDDKWVLRRAFGNLNKRLEIFGTPEENG